MQLKGLDNRKTTNKKSSLGQELHATSKILVFFLALFVKKKVESAKATQEGKNS